MPLLTKFNRTMNFFAGGVIIQNIGLYYLNEILKQKKNYKGVS